MKEETLFDVVSKWLKLLLPFVKKGPYGVYALFGRIGAGLILAGLLAWFPGVWEFLVEQVVSVASEELRAGAGGGEEPSSVNKGTVTFICMGSGLFIALGSLIGLIIAHNRELSAEKVDRAALEAHENAISTVIPEHAGLEVFVRAIAAKYSFAVSFEKIDKDQRDLPLVPGKISGLDAEAFLNEVSARSIPSNQIVWRKAGNDFFEANKPIANPGNDEPSSG